MKTNILCIYDFDNTFVRPPDEEVGANTHPQFCEVEDWWESYISLDPNYFYFPLIPEVYQDYIQYYNEANCVLLTKRNEYLLDNIKQILDSKQIKFDDYCATSHQSKVFFLNQFIEKYSPSHIRIFDDSEQNIKEFYDFCYNELPDTIEVDIFFIDHNKSKIFQCKKPETKK